MTPGPTAGWPDGPAAPVLQRPALLVLGALVVVFGERVLTLFAAGLYRQAWFADLAALLALGATLAFLNFFVAFYTHFVRAEQKLLAKATLAVIVASGLLALIYLRHVLPLLHIYIFGYETAGTARLGKTVGWLNAGGVLFFFASVAHGCNAPRERALRQAAVLASAGSALFLLYRSGMLLAPGLIQGGRPLALAVYTLAFGAQCAFFWRLLRPTGAPSPPEAD